MAAVPVYRPDQVTPEWLGAVLRAAGRIETATIEAFDTEPVGTGQMSDSIRYRLRYDRREDGAPESIVAKFAAADERSRATGVAMRTYEVEVRFYQELAPELPVRTPRCDFAEVDPATGNFVIVMEDLAPARQGDQLTGCSIDQAAQALEELARLHAPRWGDPSLESLEWLHRTDDLSIEVGAQLLPGLYPGFLERYGDRLEAGVGEMGERLLGRIRDYLAHQPRPWTVQHGDYRLDNMLFGPPGGVPLVVVDWQTAIHGPGLVDAAYFLGAGLLPEDRRAHEVDLLREYHGALVAGGVEGFSWDRCWSEYRRYAFAGFLMAVGASMMVEQTERGDEMFLAMANRHGRQILDLDSEELLEATGG